MFDFLFGNTKLKNALRRGGVIIDLRPPNRFDEGHIRGAINIPVDRVPINLTRIRDMDVPIILCGDGGDIDHARHQLAQYGVKEIHNGGSWTRLYRIVQSM